MMPWPVKFWLINYYSKIDPSLCSGCGVCANMCPRSTIIQKNAKRIPKINFYKCIGCGVCVAKCHYKAIKLVHRREEIKPPKIDDDLYETIMQNKKGIIGSFIRIAKKMMK